MSFMMGMLATNLRLHASHVAHALHYVGIKVIRDDDLLSVCQTIVTDLRCLRCIIVVTPSHAYADRTGEMPPRPDGFVDIYNNIRIRIGAITVNETFVIYST